MLPSGAGAREARAAQKSAIAGVVHDKATSKELGGLLSRLEESMRAAPAPLGEWEVANVREATRDYRRASAIPKDLAQRKAALESSAYNSWVEARSKSDFSVFAPFLEQWVEVCQQCAAAVDPSKPTYDVLLDEYEGERERVDFVPSPVFFGRRPVYLTSPHLSEKNFKKIENSRRDRGTHSRDFRVR